MVLRSSAAAGATKHAIAPPPSDKTKGAEKAQRAGADVNRFLDALEDATDTQRTALAPTPSGLQVQLRPMQQRALAFLLEHETADVPMMEVPAVSEVEQPLVPVMTEG